MQRFFLFTKLFVILNGFSLVPSVSGIDSRSTSSWDSESEISVEVADCEDSEKITTTSSLASPNALDCEISFGSLDGSDVRIGFINVGSNATTPSFIDEVKAVLKVCGHIHTDDVFEETVTEDFFIPITAKFLAVSEDVDVIIIINDSTSSLFTIETDATSVAVMQGIMDIGLHYNVPIVFGNKPSRNSYSVTYKSSYEIGKTALKMALMRREALKVVAYEQEESDVGYIGALTIILFLILLFGIIIKKSGIITDKKAIFAKVMMYCRKKYDKVEETEIPSATLA